MKILIVTNEDHYEFGVKTISLLSGGKHDWYVATNGTPYDFSAPYDVGISFMYQHKIPEEQLSHPWINFHPGPLPKYKGRNLCYHAIMNGEEEFGASVHYMDEGFDTGDIIDVWTFLVSESDTAETLSERTLQVSQDLFIEYLPRIMAGEQFTRIPNIGGRYYKKEPIDDILPTDAQYEMMIRAITYKQFYPKINIGGKIYKVVPE